MKQLYRFYYEYQCCVDDGDIGHDMWWEKGHQTIAANSDAAARKQAREFVDNHNANAHRCAGSFCSNEGLYRLKRVEQFVPETRRVRSELRQAPWGQTAVKRLYDIVVGHADDLIESD